MDRKKWMVAFVMSVLVCVFVGGFPKHGGGAPQNQVPGTCAIPDWALKASESVEATVLKLHKLAKLDTAAYTNAAPANCARELLQYRVAALSQVAAVLESR